MSVLFGPVWRPFVVVLLGIVLPAGWVRPAAAQDAADEPRYALVIGNGDYQLGQLKNPVNDARSMAAVLLETGFKTTLVENADDAAFKAAMESFTASLPKGAIALFYYAGHAFQSDGRNFLLPVDVKAGTPKTVIDESISASDVVDSFHARGIDFGIFILDACRDNPFVKDDSEKGRGLASMESEGGETLIGFSTQAGDVAYDGTGPNSPYTGALVTEMDKPGRDILDVFRAVRRSVRIWTNGQQRPFISASIERRFSFLPGTAGVAPTVIETGDLSADTIKPVIEKIWWATIADSKVPDDFRSFVEHFPNSTNVPEARNLAVSLEQQGVQVRGLDLVQFSVAPERRDPSGLSAVITSCDIVAGDPDDPRRITDGVAWGLVNARRALIECSASLADDPTNPRLQHELGRVLDIQGRYAEAEAFYKLAGGADYSASLVNLGFMYVTAHGHDRDYAEAMKLYRRAADLGNLRARTNIGEMFEEGWSVPPNIDEAVLWYRLAAQNGWPNALDTLGGLYRTGKTQDGKGLERDLNEAVRLFRTAAELDSTNAMNNLGQLYLSGDLGDPDVTEGLKWLNRAAEKGNRYATFNLGRINRDGKYAKKNPAKAVELFERAADLGFAPARIAIGQMYLNGQGVKKDRGEAAFQFTLATLTADDKRPKEVSDAKDALAAMKPTAAETDAATARANEWVRLNGG